MTAKISYRWHLRRLMADRDMYAATDLRPLLAERGVVLSREQVYRLVARTPERLSLATLAALCDILSCQPGDLRRLPLVHEPPAPVPHPGQPRARPRRAGHLGGSPITAAIPVGVAEGGNVTAYFEVLSYAGTLTLTAITDPEHFPDPGTLTDALHAGLDRSSTTVRSHGEMERPPRWPATGFNSRPARAITAPDRTSDGSRCAVRPRLCNAPTRDAWPTGPWRRRP